MSRKYNDATDYTVGEELFKMDLYKIRKRRTPVAERIGSRFLYNKLLFLIKSFSMRFSICLVVILFAFFSSKGQGKEKSGYIGVNLGTSFLLNCNDSKGSVGANLNLINAAYSFKNNFGITLKWMGAAHVISKGNEVGYGAILIGPMYSVPINDRTYLDLKLASGLFWVTEQVKDFLVPIDPNDPIFVDSKQSFRTLSLTNFAAGLALRHNFAKRWTLLILTEYNSGRNPDYSFYITGKHLQALSLNAGIAFRI